jgi:crossover junction endonuclease EME1
LSFRSDDLGSFYDYVDFDSPVTKRPKLSPTPERTTTAGKRSDQHATKKSDSWALFLSEDSIVTDIAPSGKGKAREEPPSTNFWGDDFSDPILPSSSAPDLRPANRNIGGPKPTGRDTSHFSEVISLDDTDSEPERASRFRDLEAEDEEFDFSQSTTSKAELSSRTAALPASIKNQTTSKSKASRSKPSLHTILSDDDVEVDVEVENRPTKKKRATKTSTADKATKAIEKEAAKALKEQQKALEKECKAQLKEEKAKQKQLAADIAAVNKSKTDKKLSTPEMIIDVSESFKDTSVGNQVVENMKHVGVDMNFVPTYVPNIVTWRRKVTARYNAEVGHWEPCPLTIDQEKHVLCFLTAVEFANMAAATDSPNRLEQHVLRLLNSYPKCKPIYLIEGLAVWMRKNTTIRNRAYTAAVRRQFENQQQTDGTDPPPSSNPSRRSRKAKTPPPVIDDDLVEDALLKLQVQHGCLIHHTVAAAESAEWIKIFTENISTIPYRQEKMNLQNATFCMDVGQVKPGEDAFDTYVKMLQEVHRVTAPMAYGIAMEFGDVGKLLRAMKQQGPLLLQDVKVCFSTAILLQVLMCAVLEMCQ